MKNHTKVYLEFFNLDTSDTPLCEVCGKVAVDIHHINSRGMGGSNNADDIHNLMALCRQCHIDYGDKKQYKIQLQDVHNKTIRNYLHNR